MIVEIPDDDSIIKWKMNDKDDWKSAEILDLINAYEKSPKGEWRNIDGKLYCPFCMTYSDSAFNNYCSRCGADMRDNKKETTFDDYLAEQLKDPEFRKEWEKLCDKDKQKGGAE